MKNVEVANSKKKYWFYCHITLPLGLPCQPKINDVRQMSFLLVIACFDNNGFLGVVTLNSPNGVLSRWFFPFVNKLPVSNLISIAFNLVGDLFVLPRYCMLN